MAIYHLTVKNISRGDGRSAVAAAAYRRAERLFDERLNQSYDYSDKPDVIYKELTISPHAPIWIKALKDLDASDKVQASEKLWNLVEASEQRTDARLAKEIEFALPIELTKDQCVTLAREFIQDQCANRGMIADWAIHWDEGNPHVHVMLTTRHLLEVGFGLKNRDWNAKLLVQTWRECWTEYANFYLALYQHDMRIDHRSYEERGIDLVPSIHQGRHVREMTSKGKSSAIYQTTQQIYAENLKRITKNPHIIFRKLTQERTSFTLEHAAYEVGRYCQGKQRFPGQGSVFNSIDTGRENEIFDTHGDDQCLSDQILKTANTAEKNLLTTESITALLKSIEHHEAVFTERELARALMPYTMDPEIFAKALLQLKASSQLITLGPGDDGRERYTTRYMFELENQLQDMVDDLRDEDHIPIADRRRMTLLRRYEKYTRKTLTEEQRTAIKHIVGKAAITCLVGRAGTGKSFTLGAARRIWEAQGLRVLGVALSSVAADGLAKDGGIDSRTIASFKQAIEQGYIKLSRHDVIVMDEAGMTDSLSLLAVIKAVALARAKLVLVGDPAQLQPVGPGAVFRALLERMDYIELQQVYRQRETWQQKATQLFSTGHINEAIQAYADRDCIKLLDTSAQAFEQVITDWKTLRQTQTKSLSDYLIIAHRNEDIIRLNQLARETRLQANEINESFQVVTNQGTISISVGERVLFTQNNRSLGLSNGRFATVQSMEVNETGRVLSITVLLDGEDKKQVTFNPEQFAHFTYGYAATVHKVQGLTVDHAFVYAGGKGWNRHLTYVAKSRHRYTATLYADKETFEDMDQLKTQLAQFAIKDSVLDFPLHFAARRGLASPSLLERFQQHLQQKLKSLKQTLTARWEEILHPDRSRLRKTAQETLRKKQVTKQQQREDAKLVAAYVIANQQVGSIYEKYRQKIAALGFEKIDYRSEDYRLLKGTEEYQALQSIIAERNQLAKEIHKDIERYQTAVLLNRISLKKLKAQADQQACAEIVQWYKAAVAAEQTIHRDRLAATLARSIKSYFIPLQQADIDLTLLKQHAKAHERRLYLTQLTAPARKLFAEVEHYVQLNQQVGKFIGALNQDSAGNLIISREKLDVLQTLTKARNNQAKLLYQAPDRYQPYFDYFNMGLSPHLLKANAFKADEIKQLRARWYRLEQHAMQAIIWERVVAYQAAYKHGDKAQCTEIAYHIVENARAHHRSILEQSVMPSELWKIIRQDANLYKREQFIKSLTLDEQADFRNVEAYVAAKKTVSQVWKEIFAAKDRHYLSEEDIQKKLIPLAWQNSAPKDVLAAQLIKNVERYQKGLDFYGITREDLQKAAITQAYRERVALYQQLITEDDKAMSCDRNRTLARAKVAFAICQNIKPHTAFIKASGIAWKALFQEAKIYENYQRYARLTPEERALYRLMQRYQALNRHVGKTWSRLLLQKKAKQLMTPDQWQLAKTLAAKRDYLAQRIWQKRMDLLLSFTLASDVICEQKLLQLEDIKLNWKKIQQQSYRHSERINQLNAWQDAQQAANAQLKYLVQKAPNESSFIETYWDWQSLQIDAERLASPVQKDIMTYRYALQSLNLSEKLFHKHREVAIQLRNTLALREKIKQAQQKIVLATLALAKDNDRQQRIARARTISRQTTHIQGTLAERYLREHRAIQGELPLTFRFHPGHYSQQAKRKLPALVVLAHNAQHKVQAIQIIYLDPHTANKAQIANPKMTYGVLENAAVLINQGNSKNRVALAEGPETALSIKEADPNLTIYATLGASNFARTPLNHVTEVLLCADNDGPHASSEHLLQQAAVKLAERGITVWQTLPDYPGTKCDFNDVLKVKGAAAVNAYLKQAVCIQTAPSLDKVDKQITRMSHQLVDSLDKLSPSTQYLEESIHTPFTQTTFDNLKEGYNTFGFATLEDTLSAQLQSWLKAYITPSEGSAFLVGADESQTHLLNQKARQLFANVKTVKSMLTVKTPYGLRDLAINERIRFGSDFSRHKITAGMLGTITAIKRQTIQVQLDEGRAIAFKLADYCALDYGYALTMNQLPAQSHHKHFILLTSAISQSALANRLASEKSFEAYWNREEYPNLNALKKQLTSSIEPITNKENTPSSMRHKAKRDLDCT